MVNLNLIINSTEFELIKIILSADRLITGLLFAFNEGKYSSITKYNYWT